MRIRFWGTRGSLPRPARESLRYGGNTSCVEVQAGDGTLVILDCGTGIYPLGQELVRSKTKPREAHILITHTHWDHIQGFPFFAPLFDSGTAWHIYAPGFRGQRPGGSAWATTWMRRRTDGTRSGWRRAAMGRIRCFFCGGWRIADAFGGRYQAQEV